MRPDRIIKQGDTSPFIEATLLDSFGAPVDLTGATVHFVMRAVGKLIPKVNGVCRIVDNAGAVVRYGEPWQATDVDTPGVYQGEFNAVFSDGTETSFPNGSYLIISIVPELG